MNSPYGQRHPVNVLDLHLWNIRIQAARREYDQHPTASCLDPECDDLSYLDSDRGFCDFHALEAGLCVLCQRRKRDGKSTRCQTCRRGSGSQTAAERMRLRRARDKDRQR